MAKMPTPKMPAVPKMKVLQPKAQKAASIKTSYKLPGVNGGTKVASAPKVSAPRGSVGPKVGVAGIVGSF